MMAFLAPPEFAAWRHRDARDGFEIVFHRPHGGGYQIEGETVAVEAGRAWAVAYEITVDGEWRTIRAHVRSRFGGASGVTLEAEEPGRWRVDGAPAPHLDGCLDVDLESSSYTNALPVRRLGLAVGDRADAPAAYVRAPDLRVEVLDQTYLRIEDDGPRPRYDYGAPRFDFRCELVYDETGLVVEYPGIAVRVA